MQQRLPVRLAIVVFLLVGGAAAAAAADRVKVVTRTATIRAEASDRSKAVAVVAAGTVLDVLGIENGWYKVSVLAGANRASRSGYLEIRTVMRTTERPVLVPVGPGSGVPATAQAAAREGGVRLRGFGELAVQRFTASESFDAIFGSPTGVFYGGGVDLRFGRHLFAAMGVTHFRKTGERAFAYDGEAFPLGIEDRVTITPLVVNVGYRFGRVGRFTPYVAGGGGVVFYRETAEAAVSGDNVSKTGGAFQGVGGVEVALGRRLALAVEGQYQSVRGILGSQGVSEAFNEKDLGGASARVKFLVGR